LEYALRVLSVNRIRNMACLRSDVGLRWRHRQLWLVILVVAIQDRAMCVHGGGIAYNTPFQIVKPSADHTGIQPVMEGLSRLGEVDAQIAVLSVVGPYHSGKSFLLNALVGNPEVFSIGKLTSPETMGIWMCRTEMKAEDGSEVWLMDSEGFFGPGVESSYDAKIFTIATLLGGHLVYNTVKVIDQQAVHLLEMLARQARLFRTRSSAESSGLEPPDFLSVGSFPNLTWVVEDFVQEIPEQHRRAGGATSWLKSYLTKSNESQTEFFLSKIYNDIKVHTLFLPAVTRDHLQDLSRMQWDELTPEFKAEVAQLRDDIRDKIGARQFEGKPMTGRTLKHSVQFIAQALQRGMFHELPSLWATWAKQVAEMSLQDADTLFASLLQKIDVSEDPITIAEFNVALESAREHCVFFYKELLRDFEVSLNVRDLHLRMDNHFQSKQMLYHERIHRWIRQLIDASKDAMNRYLEQIELPIGPDVLKKQTMEVIKDSVQKLDGRVKAFGVSGPALKQGKAATMPASKLDPVTQLKNELHVLLGAREAENEREIMRAFKSAVAAADEVIEQELRSRDNKLMGKAAIEELKTLISSRCWRVFDERLARHRWMMNTPHYNSHKEIVVKESLRSRWGRFLSENDKQLEDHFRQRREMAIMAYRTKKAAMQMPVAEPDLEAEHRSVAASVRGIMEEQRSDLADTESYKSHMRQLGRVLEEGLEHTLKKNIELWKVHSDDATRCALKLNKDLERQCGLNCLFNKVPNIYKKRAWKHLVACLPRSAGAMGVRMPDSMQRKVFEDWYEKELATDAMNVWYNFVLYIGVSALTGLFTFCWCCPRSSTW